MQNIEIYESTDGTEMIAVDNGDTVTSMPKAVWDELEAQREQSGTL